MEAFVKLLLLTVKSKYRSLFKSKLLYSKQGPHTWPQQRRHMDNVDYGQRLKHTEVSGSDVQGHGVLLSPGQLWAAFAQIDWFFGETDQFFHSSLAQVRTRAWFTTHSVTRKKSPNVYKGCPNRISLENDRF